MEKKELIAIRDVLADDVSFIYATWLKGIYYGDSHFSQMVKSVFMEKYHQYIATILSHPNTKVKVSCLKEEPSVILAYSVTTQDDKSVHWVFTKKSWRNIGLARDLVSPSVTEVTNLTKVGTSIMKKKDLKYNPFTI